MCSVWVPCVAIPSSGGSSVGPSPLCGSPVWVPCAGPLCGSPVWVPCVDPSSHCVPCGIYSRDVSRSFTRSRSRYMPEKPCDVVSATRRSSGVASRAFLRVYARVLVPPILYIHTEDTAGYTAGYSGSAGYWLDIDRYRDTTGWDMRYQGYAVRYRQETVGETQAGYGISSKYTPGGGLYVIK